jgi:outer membrane protein assembly factor BamA
VNYIVTLKYCRLIKDSLGVFGYSIACVLILVMVSCTCYAQETTKRDSVPTVHEIDIFDVIRKWSGKPHKPKVDTPRQGVSNVSLLPILGYSPANGFLIGAAISATRFIGDPKTTQMSTVLTNLSFTSKGQTLINLKFDLFTPGNKWYISGDNRLLFFSQSTYGLGIRGLYYQPFTFNWNGVSATTRSTLEQPMKYDYLRLYETFLRKITNGWYAGFGVHFDIFTNIQDQSLKLDSPVFLSSHYVYSKYYGFNTTSYSANGISLQVTHDSRDNPINPFKGDYFNFSFRVNPTILGSSENSTTLYTEYRTYVGVNKEIPQNLFAFWVWGAFVTSGHLPYLDLPSITWDTYNRSGRGYIQGRFRGNSMVYAETEFRFRITSNGLLGGVTFVNATTASNPLPNVGQSLFNAVAPGAGVGLRIKMNKNDRTNITVDYGMGYGFSGIYLCIREAF